MIEAKAREYFLGACDHIFVPATEVPKTIWLVFSMELLATSSMSEVGSEHKVWFGASLRLINDFWAVTDHLRKCTTDPLP